MTVQPGDIVGGHRILELAGSGGMGAVYKAEHLITRRIEAMKLLPLGLGSGPDEIERFEREIQAQARLQHPHIATLYSAVRQENAIVLVMEYVEGESLERILARGPLPLDVALHYARQVLDALKCAHDAGVIHCDVSPANILVTAEGAVKLTDFGLARAATGLGTAGGGMVVGSPWHMAPEQVRGTDPLDARADLYAVGTVLYEMSAGRKPFDAEGTFAILRAHLDTIPEPPSAHRKEVPPALDAAILRALSKNPGARFQSAGEFLRTLEGAAAARRRGTGRRRALMRQVWIAAAMASIVGAAVLRTGARRGPGVSEAEIPPLNAPAPRIPPAPLALSLRAAPAPERSRALRIPRREAVKTRAAALDRSPRVEPRAALQTAAADAALPDAPAVDPIRPETPPPLPLDAPAPAVAPPKPPRSGNRFVRALGRLNPFRKDDKDDTPAKR